MFPSLQPGRGIFGGDMGTRRADGTFEPRIDGSKWQWMFCWDDNADAFKGRVKREGREKELKGWLVHMTRLGYDGWEKYVRAANKMMPLEEVTELPKKDGEEVVDPPTVSDEPLTEEEFWQGVTKSWRVAQVSGDGRTMTALSQLLSRHLDEVGKGGRVKKTDEELADEALEEVRKMRGE